jgi:probable phosphomutase (TIGR03848 family)
MLYWLKNFYAVLSQSERMTTILLVRHAVNDYVKTGKLAGRLPDIHLNDEGNAQAEALGARLADAPIKHIYTSPLDRTMETAAAIQAHHPQVTVQTNELVSEVKYGDWEGMSIALLRVRKLWSVIQEYPSRAVFPNGEALRDAQTRAVNEIERLVQVHPNETVVVVSHADIIKMVLAHYLGMHLDNFQRLVVSPASISTITLGHSRPYVGVINDVSHLKGVKAAPKATKEAAPAE